MRPRIPSPQVKPLAATLAIALSVHANAATIAVNDPSESSVPGKCTLVDAVKALNDATPINGCAAGDGNNDTIDLSFFAAPTQIAFSLANSVDGQSALALSKPATIQGPLGTSGPLISIVRSAVSGTPAFRVLATNTDLAITGVTISNGLANARGGGVYAAGNGNLTLTHAVVSNNALTIATAGGGGIDAEHGTITLNNSTVSGNSAGTNGNGGGIYTPHSGTITLNDSTIGANTAYAGGGIYSFSGAVVVNRSTIIDNRSNTHGSAGGGGLYAYGNVTLTNSTVSGNSAVYVAGGVGSAHNMYCYFSTISRNSVGRYGSGAGVHVGVGGQAANLVSIASIISGNQGLDVTVNGYFTGMNNIVGNESGPSDTKHCDPKLGSLFDNGGPTKTMALFPGSCALDAGPSSLPKGIATDQRGLPRSVGAASDIGAFEKQGPSDPPDWIFINGFET